MSPYLSRRRWLALLPAAAAAPALAQPAANGPSGFMARAVAMRAAAVAAGDQPFGAVVARDGILVGEAPSAVVTRVDPTAHAEMEAIRDAARRLRTRDLAGAVLYSTSRPCAMCEAAAMWAGIARMVHGDALTDAGAPRLSRC